MKARPTRTRRREPRPLTGAVAMPGDKSISHRAVILGALATGRSVFDGINLGADVVATARAAEALGARVEIDRDNNRVQVEGSGWGGLAEAEDVIDCGNSGTTARTLLGVAAAAPGATVITGDASLRARPMLRVVAPLRQMGATIDGRSHAKLLPLTVRGGDLEGVDHELTVASAQVKTALLLAGSRASGATTVREPGLSRDHTERMLRAAGVEVSVEGTRVEIRGGAAPAPLSLKIPGDVSAALFFVVAALLVEGSDLTVTGVGLNPTRTGGLDALGAMGADLEIEVTGESGGEPVGTIRARHSRLQGIELPVEWVPRLIDELPVLAIAASQADGDTVVRGAGELRVKESDRIETIARGLEVTGATVEAGPDGFVVSGPTRLTGGTVASAGDHRIAMAFAVAGLVADGNVTVEGWSSVDTSFPGFLDVLGWAQGKTP